MAELQAERMKRKRADEIQMAQIEAVQEQAKIAVEKELALKYLELKTQLAQATTSNKDAKSLNLPSFIDEKDELDSYLLPFERYAENAS